MNQITIGDYIAKKRREENLTQEQLAEKLGVSNKTISKWENGKCMPDYSIIQKLCDSLHITISELMDGHDKEEGSNNTHTDNPGSFCSDYLLICGVKLIELYF